MKDYLNLFHSLIDKIHFWETMEINQKTKIFETFLSKSKNNLFLVSYFDNYFKILKKSSLTLYLKSVLNA